MQDSGFPIVARMGNQFLARLRLQRVSCNQQIARLERLLAAKRERLAAIEATIHDLEPELRLPAPTHKPNPIFARGEVTRLALATLREAGEPLPVSVIAVRILAAKGVALPPPRIRRMAKSRLRAVFAALERRGVVRTVGEGMEAKRALTSH